MDAVVVPGAQVQRGETAMLKARGQRGVAAQQSGAGIVVALGLKDLVAGHRAKLADGAIDRANQVGTGQRAGAVLQGAGEKLVEGGVAGDLGVGGLRHVDAVAPHKPGDQPRRQFPAAGASHAPGQGRQGLLRQQILR